MKKLLSLGACLLVAICLVSWGFTGHRTVALIAANHLTAQAKAAVADLLDGQSMADVSTWADEVRNTPEYKHTAPWHFLNLPIGLSQQEFNKAVTAQAKSNVYNALLDNMKILSIDRTKENRALALKFIIHFVGDLHQPMHISRAEDKGGNTIQVQFDNKGTNLHSLWDSKLLDKQGLSDVQLVEKLDRKRQQQESILTKSEPIQWIWESYQISSKIYKDVNSGNKLDDTYYNSNIGTVNNQIEKAGIRLAGILNEVFKNYTLADALKNVPKVTVNSDGSITKVLEGNATQGIVSVIDIKDAAGSIGKTVSITGKVFGSRDMGSLYLVNMGAAYPSQLLTVVLRGEAKKLGTELNGKTVRVSGRITEYKGKPQIEITDPNMIDPMVVVGGSGRKGG